MLGAIFKKARQDIQNPSTPRRLIVATVVTENWSSMQANTKGDIYVGLLEAIVFAIKHCDLQTALEQFASIAADLN